MALAILGSIFLAITANCFRKLYDQHYMKITHHYFLFMVIFIPIFFPMEGVISPSIQDWVILLLLGFLSYFASLCTIKACQMENSGKVLAVFTLPLIGLVTSQFFAETSFADYFWGLVGCACIVIGVVMLMNETEGDIANKNFQGMRNQEKGFK